MPGFIAHSAFGTKVYKQIEESVVKTSVRENRKVFNLGLQGPDIFFYFPGYFIINKKNLGSIMHSCKTREYMENMIEFALKLDEDDDKKIAIAYLAGFIGHYSLDRTCHPYIYWKSDVMNKSKDYHAKHVKLETDIDYLICKDVYRKNIVEFQYKKSVKINRHQTEIIARMIQYSISNAFKNVRISYKIAYIAVANFVMVIEGIKDRKGRKEKIIRKIEQLILGYDHFSTIFACENYKIMNDDPMNLANSIWYNPWEDSSKRNESFYDLMEIASERYQEVIEAVVQIFQNNNKECLEKFGRLIGNKSFLSDLFLDE